MAPNHVLGIDVGQTGARAEVIASSGRVLGSGKARAGRGRGGTG